ncbi:MAG TPA: hypothetical protein VFQ85_03115 [Mycobacteriales bacterium]|jgi:hypothetical protein|nr:hypothetical protein [Mycobacteriales bacterium]
MSDTPGWESPGDPGAAPGGGTPPGWGAQPGYGPQPGAPGAGPGYGPGSAPGYGYGQPGYGAPPGYGGWGTAAAPKPGVVPLRPLGLGEILDGGFSVVREYPKVTLGLSAVVITITNLVSFGVNVSNRLNGGYGSPNLFAGGGFSIARIAVSAVSSVGLVVLAGMLTVVMGEAVLGRPVTIGETWRRVRPRFFALVGAALVAGLVPYIALFPLVVPGVFLWGAWALTTPALVLERIGVRAALRRSWRLAVPDWWRVWGIRALATLIAGVIGFMIALPGVVVAFATGGFESGEGYSVAALAVLTVAGIVAGTITAPFSSGVLALLYIDRRMRVEGLDVTLARAAAAGTASP